MSKFIPLEVYLTRGGIDAYALAAQLIEEGELFELDSTNRPCRKTDEQFKKAAIKIVKKLTPTKQSINSWHPDNQPDMDEMEMMAEWDKQQLEHWNLPYPEQLGLMEHQEDIVPLGARSRGYLLIAHLLIESKLATEDQMADLAGDSSDVTTKVISSCQKIGLTLNARTLRDHIKRAAKTYIG
jgi:hypothetical protein